MSKLFRWVVASLILLLGIAWVELDIGWQTVWASWSAISLSEFLGLALLTFASYLLRAYRVYAYFAAPVQARWLLTLRVSLLHNAMNNFLPMRLGEASFPLLMRRHFGLPLAQSSAGLLWIRLADLHFLLLLLSGSLCVQFGVFYLPVLIAVVVMPLLLGLLYRHGGRRLPQRWRERLAQLQAFTPPGFAHWGRIYSLTAIIWLCKLMALTLVMLVFIALPIQQAALAVITADLSSVLPIHGLGGSGTFEAAIVLALSPFDVSRQQVLLAAVNVHLYLLLLSVVSVPLALLIPDKIAHRNKTAN